MRIQKLTKRTCKFQYELVQFIKNLLYMKSNYFCSKKIQIPLLVLRFWVLVTYTHKHKHTHTHREQRPTLD